MPVYGKGRTKRFDPKKAAAKGFNRLIFRKKGERRKGFTFEIGEWDQFRSPLGRLNLNLETNLREWLTDRYHRKSKAVTVLDWGCGDGRSINDLASLLGDRVHAYGYDHRSRHGWERNENVKFIHEDAPRLLRFIKNRSMDLIYSHYGLTHYLNESTAAERLEYLAKLALKLRPGGMMVANVEYRTEEKVQETIRKLAPILEGFEVSLGMESNRLRAPLILRIKRKE